MRSINWSLWEQHLAVIVRALSYLKSATKTYRLVPLPCGPTLEEIIYAHREVRPARSSFLRAGNAECVVSFRFIQSSFDKTKVCDII